MNGTAVAPMIGEFAAAARSWQSFYILTGTAAATLTGLMFLGVTFGARLVTKKTFFAAEAWTTPNALHFINAFGISCAMVIPTLTATVLGWGLLVLAIARLASIRQVLVVFRRVRDGANDLELTDWLYLLILPLAAYLLLLGTAVAFLNDQPIAFNLLAVHVLGVMVVGLLAAWDLLLWMALKIT